MRLFLPWAYSDTFCSQKALHAPFQTENYKNHANVEPYLEFDVKKKKQ